MTITFHDFACLSAGHFPECRHVFVISVYDTPNVQLFAIPSLSVLCQMARSIGALDSSFYIITFVFIIHGHPSQRALIFLLRVVLYLPARWSH